IRPLKKMHTTVTLSLNDFNSLRIEQLQGGVDGAEFHLTGNLSGLKAFVPPLTKTKQEGLQKIYAHIQAGASLQPAAFTDLLAKENISSDGVVSVDVQALKEESGTVSLSTTINTSDLSFKNEDILVTGVTVSIPVKKKIFLEGSKTAKPKKKQSALSPPSYTPYRNEKNIRIENITNRSATVKNITGQIELKVNSLTIQDLAMNLRDGGGGGNINIDTGERPGTKITFYFSDIDVNRLLPEISQVKGNAAISGVLGLTVVLRHIEEKLDFETIEFSVHMTKIGRESLDRILLLIDPDESKPAIIHARSKLKLANPSSARLVISGGFLSLNIDFQEGLISSLELNRIPVGSIRKLKFAQQLLEPFQAMSAPLKLMASETYKIGPTGKPVFSE
ncbi:MAG: hypothetical protein ACE5FU_14885, partial [Nitrospinota bacterium]